MGKTSWALNVAENVILAKEPKPVALFSLEMKAEDLATRIMCSVAKVSSKRIRIGVPHEDDWPHLVDAMGRLSQAKDKLFIDDTGALTPFELRTKVRRLHHKLRDQGGLGLVIVDYLQLMDPGKRVESEQVALSYISRQFKSLALELGIPIIAMSQLSRAVETRQGNKPVLSDLRGSGSIEQDADIVLFLHRPEYYEPEKEELRGKAELIVSKHRNGEVGSVMLGFLAKYTKFVNLAFRDAPPQPGAGGPSAGGDGPPQPPTDPTSGPPHLTVV
jgi:replicative DNA helicase